MSVGSVFLPKLCENPCDCLLIIQLKFFKLRYAEKVSKPHLKWAKVSKLNSIASFLSQRAHDSRHKNRNETVCDMLPRFGAAHGGEHGWAVQVMSSQLCPILGIDYKFQLFLCTFIPFFATFLFHFYTVFPPFTVLSRASTHPRARAHPTILTVL